MDCLNILDLYSGSGSWVKPWWKNVSYNLCIDSLDVIKLPHINCHMDIRDFKPDKKYHIVYASPPCTYYSIMMNCNKHKVTEDDMKEAIELSDIAMSYASSALFCYVIENPYTGNMKDIYSGFYKVDYSEYGFPMRKRTAIWSNLKLKLKIKKEINYNQYPLSYLGKKEKSVIPNELSEYIKRIIVKTYVKELQIFKRPFTGKTYLDLLKSR